MTEERKITILNVDDNEAGRYATSRILRQAGFAVKEVATGAEALRLAQENPDLIILDVKLPDIDGFEVCRRLKAIPLTAIIPVLHLSATYLDAKSTANGLESGADGYLTQPVEPPVLVAYVKALLRARQVEEALRESEEKYRNVVERANDGITIIQDTIVKYLNPRLAELWGGTVEEVIGTPFADYIHPDELSVVLDRYQRRMAGEDVTPTYETVLRRKDGSKVYAELNTGTIMLQGKPADLVIVRDITERKRVEDALRETQARLQYLLAASPVVIYSITPDFATTWVAPNVEYVLGYTVAESQAPGWWADHLHPDDRQRVLAELSDVFERAQYAHEYRFQFKDSSYHWIRDELRLIRDAQGNLVEIVGAWHDITDRKRAEETLRASHEYTRNIIDSSSDMIIAVDRDRKITEFNKAAQKCFGYSPEEILGKDVAILYADPSTSHKIAQTLKENGQITGEIMNRRKNGEVFVSFISATELRNAQGELIGSTGISRDITERKRAEEALRESEKRFSTIFLASPVAISICVPADGRCIDVNEAYLRLSGFSREELINHTTPEMSMWKTPADRQQFVDRLARKRYFKNLESVFQTKSGQVRDVLASYEMIQLSREDCILALFYDITERKRAEEALQKAREFSESLIASMQDGVSVLDAHGVHIDVNPALCQMTGFSREELIGVGPPHPYWPPEAYEEIESVFQKALRGEFGNFELTFRRKNGERFPMIISPSWIRDEQGNVISYLATVKDITERKRAEEALAHAHEQLRAVSTYWQNAIEAQRAHIAREIHDEFGQSMSALKMDLTWLTNRLPEGDERVDRIRTMAALVDGSIALMRNIATELRPGLLDDLGLNAALDWQAREFSRRSEIPCNLKLPHDDLALDPVLSTTLFRIFQETLTNVVRHAQATRVDASFQQEGKTLILTVQDNGRGITESELNDSHSLGLLGLRERAAQWGGDLTIRGTAGAGTTVTVRIPLPVSPVKGGNR